MRGEYYPEAVFEGLFGYEEPATLWCARERSCSCIACIAHHRMYLCLCMCLCVFCDGYVGFAEGYSTEGRRRDKRLREHPLFCVLFNFQMFARSACRGSTIIEDTILRGKATFIRK